MRTLPFIAAAVLLVACSKEPSEKESVAGAGAVADRMSTNAAGGTTQGIAMQSKSVVSRAAESGELSAPPASDAASADEADARAAPPPQGAGGDFGTVGAVEIAPTMVIRNGQASLEVERIDPAIVKLRQLATQLGGYIANSSMSGGHDQVRSATLELKMPAQRFDQAITGLGGIGKVESVNATAEDVGEEYVDITARVNNAHRLEDRLIALLATRTGKLQDVLSVERELARVREQIERYEGRLRFLKSRTAVSTLSVTVHEPVPILGQSPGENPIAAALRQAWRNFVGFIAGGIALLGILIPLAALGLVAWIVYRRVRKSTKQNDN